MKKQTLVLLILPIVLVAFSGCISSTANPLVFNFVATKESDINWHLYATLWLPAEDFGQAGQTQTARLLCYSLSFGTWTLEWDIDMTPAGYNLLEVASGTISTRSAGDPAGPVVLIDISKNLQVIDTQELGDGIMPFADRKFTIQITLLTIPGNKFAALEKSAGDL